MTSRRRWVAVVAIVLVAGCGAGTSNRPTVASSSTKVTTTERQVTTTTSSTTTTSPTTVPPTTAAPIVALAPMPAPTMPPATEPPATEPRPAPYVAPTQPYVPPTAAGAYYANCTAARAAGAAPLYRGDPGYRSALDRDGDGIACE